MKKFIIFLICLSLVLFSVMFSACGKEKNNDGENQNNADSPDDNLNSTVEGNDDAKTEVKILPDLPDNLDFGGYKFKVFYSSVEEAGVWGLRDIIAVEENGEVINDAVYARNRYLEGKYNFEIVGIPTTTTTMSSANMRKVIQSGTDEYDVMFARQRETAVIITAGCLVDLNEVSYLDFSKPWWDQSIIEQLSVANKIFAASGDIIATNSNALRVFLFNKNMIAEFGLDDPYRIVRENKWTLETFYNMCKDASLDVNGDGVMDEKDRYGYLVQSGITINMFYAAGEQTIVKDENDIPSISIGSEKSMLILQKINDILLSKDAVMFDSDYTRINAEHPEYVLQEVFEDRRGLFFAEVLQLAERMRATETEFGIIPPPKADENQAEYMSFADSHCMNLMLIPVTNTHLEMTGQILEAMCAESKYGLRPAYYEKALKGKYTRDNDSEEMLDIIIKNKVVSLDEMFGWGMHGAIQDVLKNRKGEFSSAIEKNLSKSQTKLEKSIATIEDLG